jgi:hypothetical protein
VLEAEVRVAVYFIREDGPDGLVKIGTTTGNPHHRMATLQTGNARPLRLLVSIPGGPTEEKAMHERFDALRVRHDDKIGVEWFRPGPELLGFIEGLVWQFKDQQPKPEPDVPTLYGLTLEQVQAVAGAMWMYERWDSAWTLISRARGIRNEAGVCIGCGGARDGSPTMAPSSDSTLDSWDAEDPDPWCSKCSGTPQRWVGMGGGLPARDPAILAEEAAAALQSFTDHLVCLDEPDLASTSTDGAAFARGREQVKVCRAIASAFPMPRPGWGPPPPWVTP